VFASFISSQSISIWRESRSVDVKTYWETAEYLQTLREMAVHPETKENLLDLIFRLESLIEDSLPEENSQLHYRIGVELSDLPIGDPCTNQELPFLISTKLSQAGLERPSPLTVKKRLWSCRFITPAWSAWRRFPRRNGAVSAS
jgi:hypothetical protein